MSVGMLCDLFIDAALQKVEIFDCDSGKVVFSGRADEVPDEFEDLEIMSIDNVEKGSNGVVTINI